MHYALLCVVTLGCVELYCVVGILSGDAVLCCVLLCCVAVVLLCSAALCYVV